MPARVITDPLAVRFVFSDARRYTLKLDHFPCPELVLDLAHALARIAHPHGRVDSRSTVEHYRTAIGMLSRFADQRGFRGGAAALTWPLLREFWMGTSRSWEHKSRTLLASWDATNSGLVPQIRDHLAGQPLKVGSRRRATPFAPYSTTEWERLRGCCERITGDALREHRQGRKEAEQGRDPAVDGEWTPENALWLLSRRGPLREKQIASHMGLHHSTILKRGGFAGPAGMLFPTVDVALAYRLLLGITTGIVPDGLADLGLRDLDWAGDTTVLLDFVKGRSGPQSLVLSPAAVRVLRRWLEHSALLRTFAAPEDRGSLWLAYSSRYKGNAGSVAVPRFSELTMHRWIAKNQLLGDDGHPFRMHKHRIRTTFENNRDTSAWTGRATIDPNHSSRVEGDHYLSRPTPVQSEALDTVIEEAQADLVRKAHTPLVLASEDVEAATSALPAAVQELVITPAVVAELVGGTRDVFTTACVDQLAGIHGPAGRPCPARPWVCLLCPLAVFAPRHAPNLLRLKAFFARQFRQMPTAQFMAVFGAYADRLDQDILPRFAPAVLASAAAEIREHDDELPLRPEEGTA